MPSAIAARPFGFAPCLSFAVGGSADELAVGAGLLDHLHWLELEGLYAGIRTNLVRVRLSALVALVSRAGGAAALAADDGGRVHPAEANSAVLLPRHTRRPRCLESEGLCRTAFPSPQAPSPSRKNENDHEHPPVPQRWKPSTQKVDHHTALQVGWKAQSVYNNNSGHVIARQLLLGTTTPSPPLSSSWTRTQRGCLQVEGASLVPDRTSKAPDSLPA